MTRLFNINLKQKKFSKLWKKSDIILIFKKGYRHNIETYRPSLSPTIAKISSKVIQNFLRLLLNFQQPFEQALFRRGYLTIDHLFTVNMFIEKVQEYQFDFHLAFTDCKKAFDSNEH